MQRRRVEAATTRRKREALFRYKTWLETIIEDYTYALLPIFRQQEYNIYGDYIGENWMESVNATQLAVEAWLENEADLNLPWWRSPETARAKDIPSVRDLEKEKIRTLRFLNRLMAQYAPRGFANEGA